MTTIKITYSELRKLTNSVMTFVKEEYWLKKNSSLKTEIDSGLGITGDDAWELMEKFSKRFSVDLSNFNFNNYFLSEGFGHSEPFIITLIAFSFPFIYVFRLLLAIFIYPLNKKLSKRLSEYRMKSVLNKYKKSLEFQESQELESITIGDLVTSAACGKFAKWKSVRFE